MRSVVKKNNISKIKGHAFELYIHIDKYIDGTYARVIEERRVYNKYL